MFDCDVTLRPLATCDASVDTNSIADGDHLTKHTSTTTLLEADYVDLVSLQAYNHHVLRNRPKATEAAQRKTVSES